MDKDKKDKDSMLKLAKLFIAISLATSTFSAFASTPIMMGYYNNWDGENPINYPYSGNAQNAVNNDLGYKLARVNTVAYDFFEIDANGNVYFTDPWTDLTPDSASGPSKDDTFCTANPATCPNAVFNGNNATAGLGNFDAFALINPTDVPNRIISIGGAGHDDAWQSAMNNPATFAKSVAALVKYYNLTGVDIDYEPVGGMPASNYQAFINMVIQLRQALGPNAMITYAIPANPQAIAAFGAKNWEALMQQINYVDVMGYDLHGEFDNPRLTGLHSALYSVPGDPTAFSDDAAVTALKSIGVAPGQIILGFPTYGRAVTGVNGVSNPAAPAADINIPFTASYQGDLDTTGCTTAIDGGNTCGGMVQYRTILAANLAPIDVPEQGQDDDAYSYNNGMFISYDDPESVTAKANYVKSEGLGGMMFWGLRYDAPAVNADGSDNPASLIDAADKVLGISARPYTPAPTPSAYTLTVINNDNAVGVSAVVGSFTGSYQGTGGVQKVYSPSSSPSTSGIEGGTNLQVSFTYWGSDVGTCTGNTSFNFNKNTTITISNVLPNGGKNGTATCVITQQ